MNTGRSRSISWLFPAAAAVLIIGGFSYILHLRSGKQRLQTTPAQSSQASVSSVGARTSTLDLVGIVKSAEGQPLPNASVFIYTAQPRSGPGFL